MSEKSETEKKMEALKAIYDDSVRLLDLLNVMIPKIDNLNADVSSKLLSEVSDKCFELGGNLCCYSDNILTKTPSKEEQEESESEMDAAMMYFGGPGE